MSKEDTLDRRAVDLLQQLSSVDRKAVQKAIDTTYTFSPSELDWVIQDLQQRVYGKKYKQAIERAVKNRLKLR